MTGMDEAWRESRLKLLFLHRDLPPESYTGVAVQVHRLANALADMGHEVSVYSQSAKPADARYRLLPIRLAGLKSCLRLLPGLKRLWYPLWYRTLDFRGYDAVHIHGDGGFLNYRANFVRTFYGTAAMEFRYARSLKGKLAQGLSYWLERREAGRCRMCVGISPHVAAHLPGVVHVVPCMLGSEPDLRLPTKTPFPSLVYLGSRHSRKRGEVALDLFLALRTRHPDLRLAYVGPAAETTELRRRPEYAGVDFHSGLAQAELDALYRRSWIYLCLSSYEGFGVGIIEAMAFSCLVATTPHPGSEYLIRDGENGLLARPGEEETVLARALGDAGMRLRITDAAREFSRRFAPRAVASDYLELYRRLRRPHGEAVPWR